MEKKTLRMVALVVTLAACIGFAGLLGGCGNVEVEKETTATTQPSQTNTTDATEDIGATENTGATVTTQPTHPTEDESAATDPVETTEPAGPGIGIVTEPTEGPTEATKPGTEVDIEIDFNDF